MGIKVEESDEIFLKELEVLRDEGIDIVINWFEQCLGELFKIDQLDTSSLD
jgi:hypothetical protein